jgi:ATP-dependent phosphoenolpyruvate carboxykinase
MNAHFINVGQGRVCQQATKLAQMFVANFRTLEGVVTADVRTAGPAV